MKAARHAFLFALIAATSLVAGEARAEVDTFALGSGRSGPLVVAGADTVINAYAPVTTAVAVGTRSVTVGATVGTGTFAAGDLVMVWQVTDGFVNTPTSGDQTPLTFGPTSKTGRYELGRVFRINGASVELTFPLVNAYDPNVTQLVRIPEHTTVSIPAGGSLVARPWNGATGGIVAFLANGAVTNDGTIDASAAGFRGGVVEPSGGFSQCTALDGPSSANGGAHKGEGLFAAAYSPAINTNVPVHYGRGNRTIGGGGGDCHNAGGGGGGHGGAGGGGGTTYALEVGGPRAVGGIGGTSTTYSASGTLIMGGGGGAGDMNDNTGSAGGAGGGVVWLRATSLGGAGTIASNGVSAASSGPDGAGGGGAGGLLFVQTTGALACGGANARGGDGGDTTTTDHSTGGGGGGGRVVFHHAGGTCAPVNTGGASGLSSANAPLGATGGANGTTTDAPAIAPLPCNQAIAQCGGCVSDAECTQMAPRCNPVSHACFKPQEYGQAPITGDTCVAAPPPTHGTAATCRDGICDKVDDKCGYANGTVCGTTDLDKNGSIDSGCRSGACAADGKCGVPDGSACTMSSQCRSNDCRNGSCAKDTDGDGLSDAREMEIGTSPTISDTDRDGIPDGKEAPTTGTPPDSDKDGLIDALDADDDGDGLATSSELGPGGAGQPLDSDGDGIPDYLDNDDDNDGIPTATEVADARRVNVPDDLDKDGRPNWRDDDADGDGKKDADERGDVAPANGIPDYLEGPATPITDDGNIEGAGGIACNATPNGTSSTSHFVLAGLLAVVIARLRRYRKSS